ncbi:hypothetical protein PR048_024982 [Dryococelus australis]|uniref:Uncharacterized protein n=1 Tax=Dryococelus australis TaxID=614101 RepID=A0ABQ9GQ32_9NEOP|nr:hypothetical protein PR048_024982 [Dryococelus australis]
MPTKFDLCSVEDCELIDSFLRRSRGGWAVRLLASHHCEPGSNPSLVGIVADDAAGPRILSGISRFPRPFIPALRQTHLVSPSSALKTSMLEPSKYLYFLAHPSRIRKAIHLIQTLRLFFLTPEQSDLHKSFRRHRGRKLGVAVGVEGNWVVMRAALEKRTVKGVGGRSFDQPIPPHPGSPPNPLFIPISRTAPPPSLYNHSAIASAPGSAREKLRLPVEPRSPLSPSPPYSPCTHTPVPTPVQRFHLKTTTHPRAMPRHLPPPSNVQLRARGTYHPCWSYTNTISKPCLGCSLDLNQYVTNLNDTTAVREVTVAERLARSPPTKPNRAQSPVGSPDFGKWESCRTMSLFRGFSRGSPVSPALSFRRSIFTSITLIGSQDLAVKSRPNLFTHSPLPFWCRNCPKHRTAGRRAQLALLYYALSTVACFGFLSGILVTDASLLFAGACPRFVGVNSYCVLDDFITLRLQQQVYYFPRVKHETTLHTPGRSWGKKRREWGSVARGVTEGKRRQIESPLLRVFIRVLITLAQRCEKL